MQDNINKMNDFAKVMKYVKHMTPQMSLMAPKNARVIEDEEQKTLLNDQ